MTQPTQSEPTAVGAPKVPEPSLRPPTKKTTSPYLTQEWLRPFAIGGFASLCLVLFVLFLVPSAPTTTTTTTVTTVSPSEPGSKPVTPSVVVAQAAAADLQPPVIEHEIDGRPLPKLPPPTWFNPSKVLPSSAAPVAPELVPAQRRATASAKAEEPGKPFVPTPPYQRPVSQSQWADEALAEPQPDSK